MEDILLGVFATLMIAGFAIGAVMLFKKAEFCFVFTSEKTLNGVWLLFNKKLKNGKIKIGDGEYLVGNTKPFLLKHKMLGYIPAYFVQENNPEPLDLSRHFPRSKLTAKAVSEMGKMNAVEKIMTGSKEDFSKVLIFLLIGVALGAMFAFTLLFMGIIEVPVGVCTSNPAVISAVQNMTQYVAV